MVLDLGVQELGHEVVRRVLGAPVDVLGEHVAGEVGLRRRRGLAVGKAQALVEAFADRLLVLLRDAEQIADRPCRHVHPEVTDEVEAPRADERVEGLGAELPHPRLDPVHPPRGEHP